ncbi:MAG: hypothetical protein K6F04_01695 [bacterium]|nr:hypothetical protein [bacterium]
MNISDINKSELNDDEIFSLLGIDVERKELPVNKHKRKGSELRDKKRELGLEREELRRLKSEKCPYFSKGVMGGPAFQWNIAQSERIDRCEKRIATIKTEIAALTQKQR